MTAIMAAYVRFVDRVNYRVGRVAMYLIFVMMGVLLWSSFTKTAPFMRPSLWTLETAQYLMVAFYMLGGAYSIQLGSNVRMDLIYGSFDTRGKALMDCFTVVFMILFLLALLFGGINSFAYSLGHFRQEPVGFFGGLIAAFFSGGFTALGEELGVLERSRSVWRPVLWPVKLIMLTGLFMMLLQAFSELFKDIARFRHGEVVPFGTMPAGAGEN